MNGQQGKTCCEYEAPAVVYEAQLEVRAGSPMSIPDPAKIMEELP